MDDFNRREFLKRTAILAGGLSLTGCGAATKEGEGIPLGQSTRVTNMCGFAAPALEKVRVGIIGLGMRGEGAVSRLSKLQDVEIVALCDLVKAKVTDSQETLRRNNRLPAAEYAGDHTIWKQLCEREDLDLVYIVTPWKYHTPMSVFAMENGKHAASEVPVCVTVEEAWQLVETSERTKRHAVILENCCYDFFEMQTLNMVRQGVFGELTHAEGAYIHTLSQMIADDSYEERWRFHQNKDKTGNLYPTHGLGPVAQCLNINRGNKFDFITSVSSKEASFTHWAQQNDRPDLTNLPNYRGDMNTSIIKCAKGQTIMLQHDTSTPRPYSRIHLLQGTRGCARKWPTPKRIALDTYENGHVWLDDDRMKEVAERYQHPLHKTIGEVAKKVGGHGGMDFVMDYRLVYCLKNGLPMDMDCYDAAAWSVITPLSITSNAGNGDSQEVPDFTRGAWQKNAPLGIVDVDPEKLPVVEFTTDGTTDGVNQLNVES